MRDFAVGSISGSDIASAADKMRSTARFASVVAPSSSTMWRTIEPEPISRPSGSGSSGPWLKKMLTQRGYTAIENTMSPVFSVGPKPIASAL